MKIGIEGQRLFRKKKHGMDFVALELIKSLQKIDAENEYVIFVRPDQDNGCLAETDNFRIVEIKGFSYPDWEQFALPTAAKKAGVDLLHCTGNTAPYNCPIPLLLTLHDIIYLENSFLFNGQSALYQRLGNLYRRLLVPQIVKKTRLIVTVSEYEKGQIMSGLNLPHAAVEVVYNGVGDHFKPVKKEEMIEDIRKKYNLPDKFIFYLGNTDPKKNLRGVVKAFCIYLKNAPEKIPLVIADYNEEKLAALLKEFECQEFAAFFHILDYIKNSDLSIIYSSCELFLYPSLRESFGIPILEAMACGAPVITSKTSSMPEVAGDAAVLVDPANPEEMASAILNCMSNMSSCEKKIAKGLERVHHFSWQETAKKYLSIYQNLV